MATILTKRSNTASSVPLAADLTNSTSGAELAVNTADKRLFTKDSGGTVVELGTNPSSLTLTGGTANGVPYLNGSKVLTTGSALTFDGSQLAVTGSVKATAALSGVWDGSTGTYQTYKYNGTSVGDIGTANQAVNGSTGDFAITSRSGNLIFGQNTVEQMRLTSTGLGIGTSSPGYKLDVNGSVRISNGTNPYIALYNGSNTGYVQVSSGNLDFVPPSSGNTTISSGNLGLGVTPSAWTSSYKAFDVSSTASFTGNTGGSAFLVNNAYNDGSWKYKTSTVNIGTQLFGANPNGSGGFAWYTAPSGTAGNAISFSQIMTLDASGRLGIGTTSPTYQLVVSNAGAAGLEISPTGGIGSGGFIQAYNRSSGTFFDFTTYAANIIFATGAGTERARIDSSGNLLVGTTTAYARLTVKGSNEVGSFTDTSGTGLVRFRNSSESTIGYIQWSGSTTSYVTSSDYRLKEDIQPMTGALAKVAQLKPCTYKWKADGSDGEGFIAHELAEVCPDAVTGEKDAVDAEGKPVYQGIDTSFLAGLYAAALQELNAKVEALTAELNTLKGN